MSLFPALYSRSLSFFFPFGFYLSIEKKINLQINSKNLNCDLQQLSVN